MTYEPPVLTFADAVRAARKAFNEGRLGAQRGRDDYLYSYGDDIVCAIGAALNPDIAQECDRLLANVGKNDIGAVCNYGILSISDDDLEPLHLLQDLHDRWLGGGETVRGRRTQIQWIDTWVDDNIEQLCSEALFEDFLTTAERELGLA